MQAPPSFPPPRIGQQIVALFSHALAGLMRPMQSMRASQFALLSPGPGKVVFLGDSITAGGLWQEWFPGAPVLDRGTSGEQSADVLRRLGSAINAPRTVFLLIGTNDITALTPLATIVANVREILTEITRRAPNAPVYLQSVMPRDAARAGHVKALNKALRALVSESGANICYLDLWPALAAPDDTLRQEFTADRLHLNGAGYKAWTDVLRPYVESSAPLTENVA